MARPKKQQLDLGKLVDAGARWLNAHAEAMEYRLATTKKNEEVLKQAQERIIGSFVNGAEKKAAALTGEREGQEVDLASFLAGTDKQ